MFPALVLCVLATILTPGSAVTWKLTSAAPINLTAWQGLPTHSPDCTVPGVCVPYTVKVAPGQLLYWCGWDTKSRTEYWINSTTTNVTTLLMREDDLMGCALANLSRIKTCQVVDLSMCDTKTSCYLRMFGMAFVDRACFLIANNDKTNTSVTFTLWQYYDGRRTVGTAFAVILFILVVGWGLGSVGYNSYIQIKKPSHRIDELARVTPAVLRAPAPDVPEAVSRLDGIDGLGNPVPAVNLGVSPALASSRPGSAGLVDKIKGVFGKGPEAKGGHDH
ncbi:hypothetical protein V8C86DRAFT_2731750 [Haematococcus lacustris]